MSWELGESYCSIKDDFGIYVFKNGDRYIGEWKNKSMDGMGMYIFHSPEPQLIIIYFGDFQNGRFHGFGKLAEFHDNTGQMIYRGSWVDGKKNHLGLHYYKHPHTFYFGEWINDLKSGEGKLIFQNGEFNGMWQSDHRNGFGRLLIRTQLGIL